ncbi:sensor histidine kinase [Corallococcus carmarthensis]|uniref:histidine kinase n=1 Tax=Corallococcus carmarthensis TaxID=2316728 RepID=A0A3A8KK26_9BACT|nr:hybrid sensor histidine kinase/response regulator [Corallococcus carmarthensis]NOK18714.1 hybrid sensor histidine kinase/response regulator [Corallococcus carmarthensis]RKH02782.1 hybrid sensor histidine kinase/response regulator [Corallococcus carmarthensis]
MPHGPPTMPATRSPVVWLLEDSPTEAQAARAALSTTCDVILFSDGAVLVESLGFQKPPDVLVLDRETPGLTGLEVCAFVRSNAVTALLPVLLLTSHQRAEDVVEGLGAGANDYVFKPFRSSELAARVLGLAHWGWKQRQTTAALDTTRRDLSDEQARRTMAESVLAEVRAAELRAWKSDQRFRLASRATQDAIWEWDPQTDALEWSSGGQDLLGRLDDPRVPRQDWWRKRIHPEDLAAVRQSFMEALSGSSDVWRISYRFHDARGAWRDVEEHAIIVRNGEGEVQQVVGALRDVTSRKQLEAEARQRANFERQLIGIVSHDLRTPLSAVLLSATLLQEREHLTEAQHKRVGRIRTSAERAVRMIRDLLDFTQVRHGGLTLHPRDTDFHALVEAAVEETQTQAPGRVIAYSQAGDGAGTWDADRLTQVVGNLLGNALAYGDPAAPIQVRTRGETDSVVLEVHNAGAPIPADLLPRLFEPLERGAPHQESRADRSIGLGLFIVRQVVHAHGGTVSVTSLAQAGTTFTVRLPRRSPASPPASRPG